MEHLALKSWKNKVLVLVIVGNPNDIAVVVEQHQHAGCPTPMEAGIHPKAL